LLLVDLDNTLIDRVGAVDRWAREFASARGGDAGDAKWLVAGLLPDGNRPANRAATFARHTDAIKQPKQKARATGADFPEGNES
jgi:hypothetical protein